MEDDKAKLRQLIYSCDQKVNIPQTLPVLKRSMESAQDPAFQHTEAEDTVKDLSHSIRIHRISRYKSQFKTYADNPQTKESSQEGGSSRR